MGRTDTALHFVRASTRSIYRAFVDPAALVSWLPPQGMNGRIDVFEPWPGGRFHMTLTYERPGHRTPGKSSEHADVVRGEFVELVPDRRIVQRFAFESEDPSFAGIMTMTWTLAPAEGGTQVEISCENVPEGISAEDHAEGLRSSLQNLAAYCETGEAS